MVLFEQIKGLSIDKPFIYGCSLMLLSYIFSHSLWLALKNNQSLAVVCWFFIIHMRMPFTHLLLHNDLNRSMNHMLTNGLSIATK